MRVRFIREATGPNPDYDSDQARDQLTNWPVRTIAVGSEVDSPDAWLLCVSHYGKPPLAEPVDDEAKARVENFQKSRRGQRLRRRRKLPELHAPVNGDGSRFRKKKPETAATPAE